MPLTKVQTHAYCHTRQQEKRVLDGAANKGVWLEVKKKTYICGSDERD